MYCDPSARLEIVSGPAAEPLTLDEAKTFLRIEHAADDALIARAITAARQTLEKHLRIVLLAQSLRYVTGRVTALVALPMGPAQQVTLAETLTDDGVATTIANGLYRPTIDGFGVLFDQAPAARALRITYNAYYATSAAAVPAALKQGMLHHVASLVQARDGSATLPAASLQLYYPFRQVRL